MTGNPFDNREFRDEFSKVLDERLDDKLTPLVRTVEAHGEKLDEHTKSIEQGKGASRVIGSIWGFLGACLGATLQFLLRR